MGDPVKILIVDDEPLIRLNLRALLEDLSYSVCEAGDGRQALEHCRQSAPDLVLTDLRMPIMGGMELVERLRETAPEIPVLVISGTGSIADAIAAVRLGAWDYLTKPVEDAEALEIVIRRALERARMMTENRNYQCRLEEMVRERTGELAASEARYRRILESVTSYVYTVAMSCGRPVSTLHRQGCEAVSGFTPDDYAADPDLWYRMVHEDDRPMVLARAREIMTPGAAPVCYESRIRHKNGSVRWIQSTLVPNRAPGGEILSYDGIVNDITARKLAEQAQLLSESRFRELLENVRLVAVILDTAGRVTFCNDFFLELTGWSREEVLGSDWFSRFVPAGSREAHCRLFLRGIADGSAWLHAEQRILTREGCELIVLCDNTLLLEADGAVAGVATIGVDLTGQRQLEEKLRHAQKMEAVGSLAGCVAHDFNNIMTVILTCCLLMKEYLPEGNPGSGYLDLLKGAADRAVHLTRSLLAFSRKQPLTLQTVDLNCVVRELDDFLVMILGGKIELRTALRTAPLNAQADRPQIEQVLMNLATNARDAMPEGGVLTIRTELLTVDASFIERHGYGVAGDFAAISVADSGMGMSEETRKRIFEPYFTTKEEGKGTGLGLSIVYGIVKQHNGFVDVQSEPGIGTTFSILIPAARQEEDALNAAADLSAVAADPWLASACAR